LVALKNFTNQQLTITGRHPYLSGRVGALVKNAWQFVLACSRLITDSEIYMLVWLTVRNSFNRSSSRPGVTQQLAQPKVKAKAAAATQSPSAPE
jgi:hypothetical protein